MYVCMYGSRYHMYDFFMRIEEEIAIEEEQLHGIKRQRRNRRIGVGLATRDYRIGPRLSSYILSSFISDLV